MDAKSINTEQMSKNKQSSVTQLIEEIKRRVSIIQSEPQTMARELMIDNLAIDLEQYELLYKDNMLYAWGNGWANGDIHYKQFDEYAEIFYKETFNK